MTRQRVPDAVARIQGSAEYPKFRGIVRLFQRNDGIIIEAEIFGLPKTETGFFAFHIHEGGSCVGEGFSGTGGHFNPGRMPHPRHAGDLPPLLASHGKAYLKVLTDRFSILEAIGKTVVIHSGPDDFHTQPAGNAGTKIGCGVIVRPRRNV